MALDYFKPTLWSRQFINNMDRVHVFKNIVTTRYEGELSFGQALKINEIGDIDVSDYAATGGVTWQDIDDASQTLVIDQKKYFAFAVDDVDKAQMNVDVMNGAMAKAAHTVSNTVDTHLAGRYTQAALSTSNLGSSGSSQAIYAASGGHDGVLGVISNMNLYMNSGDVPVDGRWAVVDPTFAAYMKYASLVDDIAGGIKQMPDGRFVPGYIGSIYGINFFMSNNVSNNGTQYRIMFGSSDALAYVGQLAEIKAVEREDYFADGMKGLYIYGSKVVRPDHLGCAFLSYSGYSS